MKKSIVFFYLFFSMLNVIAQNDSFKKGDNIISGSIGLFSENDKDLEIKSNSISFFTGFGHFIKDNISLGASLGIISGKEIESNIVTDDARVLAFDVFGRYYLNPKSKILLFGQLDLGCGFANDNIADIQTRIFNISATPGIDYFITEKIALEAGFGTIGYTFLKDNVEGANGVSRFDLNLNLGKIDFGVIYRF